MTKSNIIVVSVSVLVAAAAITAAVFLLSSQKDSGLELEANATVGILPGVDMDERLRQLQQILDDSKIAFSVNTSPIFQAATGEGNLMLENPANNAKLLTAELVLSDSGKVLYASKALSPGTYLDKIKLHESLSAGVYDATVYLKAYTQDTQELIGQTGAQITLTVTA